MNLLGTITMAEYKSYIKYHIDRQILGGSHIDADRFNIYVTITQRGLVTFRYQATGLACRIRKKAITGTDLDLSIRAIVNAYKGKILSDYFR